MLNASTPVEDGISPLLSLPDDLLQLVILELPLGCDVKALSRSCHALHALFVSGGLELAAAWLWRRHGNQALCKAQERSDVTMLRQLIQAHHADINFSSQALGRTILHCACYSNQQQVVQFLLTAPGVQVNKPDQSGWTALLSACYGGHEAVILELLQHPSINVNHLNECGFTALHFAVRYNRIPAVKALLGHPGINIHIRDLRGRTALSGAETGRFTQMEALMKPHEEKCRSGPFSR